MLLRFEIGGRDGFGLKRRLAARFEGNYEGSSCSEGPLVGVFGAGAVRQRFPFRMPKNSRTGVESGNAA